MVKVYSLYLSTLTTSGPYAPVDKSNLASVQWSINWNSLFGITTTDKCRVKFYFNSQSSGSYDWDTDTASFRCSFSGNKNNNTNFTNIGPVHPANDPVSGVVHRLYGNTMDWGIGIEINIPKDNQIFYTNLQQMNGNLVSGFVDEWECWWVFEVDE
jgi:hypothetical protein